MVNGKKQIMMVVILDLSVAFDMEDHDILLTILSKQFGICGKVLVLCMAVLSVAKS